MLTSNPTAIYLAPMTEVELKLSLDPADVQKLRRHPLLAAVKPETLHLHSVYLDTPAWDLVQRRIAFRVRKAGRQWLQTLKAEAASVGALTRRLEWEGPLPRGHHDLSRLPDAAMALLKGVDVDLIGPAFATDFRRTTWQLTQDGTTMEVALDVGEIRSGSHIETLCEVEIELKSGPRDALFTVAQALLERVPLGVEPRSKAARGYALAGAVTPAPVKVVSPDLEGVEDAGLAWSRLAEAALVQAVGNVPGFLNQPEDIEYLHQLRIGLRRLHTVAGLAGRLEMGPPGWDAGVKSVLEALNKARDWDVLLAETLPGMADILANQPLTQATLQRLRREGSAARRGAQGAISQPEFTRLVLTIGQELQGLSSNTVPSTGPRTDSATTSFHTWAAECLEAQWEKTLKRGRGFDRLDLPQRHRLRIAAKRMRYTADVLAPAFARSKGFMERLARLQNRLGLLQDNVAATRLLSELQSRSQAVQFDIGRLVGILATEMEGRGQGGGQAWRALRTAKPFWRGATGAKGKVKPLDKGPNRPSNNKSSNNKSSNKSPVKSRKR